MRVRFDRALAAVTIGILLSAFAPARFGRAIGNDGADGHFERRESLHFTLYQDVDLDEHSGLYGSRAFEQNVLRALESAYDRLSDELDLRPTRKLDVTVWDPALFDARFARVFRFPAAGFYGGSIHIRGSDRVTETLVRVLHHELVHAALDAEAPQVTLPAWLNEGLAEWFEARASGSHSLGSAGLAHVAAAARAGRLPSLAELSRPSFAGLGPESAAIAYLESHAFIDFLAGLEGERGLAELWSNVVHSGSLARGVKRAFRRDLATLELAFRQGLGAR